MTRRSIILFPVLSGAEQIDAIRSAYDPLASKIPPHITLVFPFDSPLSPEQLPAHVKEAVKSSASFRISLGKAEARKDWVWLPVVHGRAQVMALHQRLYRGPLARHLDINRTFEPHLTVAHSPERHPQAYQAALTLRGPFEAVVDRLVIEKILPDDSSMTEHLIEFRK